jgi:hypothetical protein
LGEDGHTASLFPGSEALQERLQLVTAAPGEKLHAFRISLTLPVLNHAAGVMFLVSGKRGKTWTPIKDAKTGGCPRFLLEIDRLVDLLGLSDRKSLAEIHRQRILEAIRAGRLIREEIWTESIAVGGEAFLTEIASRNKMRKKLKMARTGDVSWYVRENRTKYAGTQNSEINSQNGAEPQFKEPGAT